MKTWIALLLIMPLGLLAQPEDEDIVYYTDSEVNDSRFGLAFNVNPVYSDLRIINNQLGLGGADFQLEDENAMGSFQLNFHGDLTFDLSPTFELSAGFGRAYGRFTLEDVQYFGVNNDTNLATYRADISMYTVPIKINFHTPISEIFDLEVVPVVELNFIDRYQATFDPQPAGIATFEEDYSDDAQSLNYSVGLSLGGTFWMNDNLGLFVRGTVKYMLNQMVDLESFPRETLLNYGLNLGVRYHF